MSDYDELGAHILERINEFNKQESELDQLRALARRVHAECGPRKGYMIGTAYWVCDGCGCEDYSREDIPHPPDCLWLAADALLKGAGQL